MQTYQQKMNGFSLIEILVAAGLISIIGLSVASLMVSFHKENKSLSEKLESIELEQGLNRILADNSSCSCLFDSPAWTTSDTQVSLTHLKRGCTAANFLVVNAPVSPQSQLIVDSIKIKNINPIGGGNLIGDIEIALKGGVASMKPITIPGQSFVPDSSSAPTKISSCLGVAGASQMCTSMGGTWIDNKCKWPGATPVSTEACVAAFGADWTYNGTACVPPGGSFGGNNSVGMWVSKKSYKSVTPPVGYAPCDSDSFHCSFITGNCEVSKCFPMGSKCALNPFANFWILYSCEKDYTPPPEIGG